MNGHRSVSEGVGEDQGGVVTAPTAGSECEDCAGTGMTLTTRSVVDPVRGGFEEEFEELCPTCEGEGI